MIRIFVISSYIIACIFFGDWYRWKDYYPTILYVIIVDFIHDVIFQQYTLWQYMGWANSTFTDFTYLFIVYPCAINLFLTYFPKGKIKSVLYILAWTTINILFEYISYKTGYFAYDHSWNIFWSAGLLFMGFTLTKIHYHHNIIVWPVSFLFIGLTVWIFKMPFALIK